VTARVKKLPTTVVCALIAGAGLLVLAAGMFVVVLPQSHKAKSLDAEIQTARTKVVTARALATQKPEEKIRAADLFKVVEAMPDDTDMSGVILQLQQTAVDAGVQFDSIQPGSAQTGAGYDIQPIDLAFEGNYFSLTDFLYRLRRLVEVHNGRLDATGRLFSVDKIDFQPAAEGFPKIAATVTVDAYVYDPVSPSPLDGVVPATGSTTTTTTTPATTTPSSGASAAGAPS
jgi:type IV pilus assembly protein PilO